MHFLSSAGWCRALVYRSLILLVVCGWLPMMPVASADPVIPVLSGRVVDQAHILSETDIRRLDNDLARYEETTSTQIVVVTLSDLQGDTIEGWGLALLRGWQIGQQGKNNGIVLVVAPNDRKMRIETGYGAEGPLPDATASVIIRTMIVPHFRDSDFAGGIFAGVDAIKQALAGNFNPDPKQPAWYNPLFLLSHITLAMVQIAGLCLLLLYLGWTARRVGIRVYSGTRYWSIGKKARSDSEFHGLRISLDQGSSDSNSSSNSSSSGSSFGSSSSGSTSSFSGGGGSGGGGGASGSW